MTKITGDITSKDIMKRLRRTYDFGVSEYRAAFEAGKKCDVTQSTYHMWEGGGAVEDLTTVSALKNDPKSNLILSAQDWNDINAMVDRLRYEHGPAVYKQLSMCKCKKV
jgi:hypothetical protein